MTKDQEKRVVGIYGPAYHPIHIPTIIRRKEAEKSEADQREADDLRQREDKELITDGGNGVFE